MSTKDQIATMVWAEIAASGRRQAEVARLVGISEKHLSQVINGKCGIQPDLLDFLMAQLGREVVVTTRVQTLTAIPDPPSKERP